MTVQQGELCVVLGPSGSGKSTLLRIVAGFDRPSAGSVTVAGIGRRHARTRGRPAGFRSRSIGYADQHYWRALAGELTARELVGVQLGLAGEPRCAARRARGRAALARRPGRPPRRASSRALRRRAAAHRALRRARAHARSLLIADEPTGELDAATAREVLDLIAELTREEGGTALVVSHDPASADRADRVVHVRDGRVSDERVAGERATARSSSAGAAGFASPRTCFARPESPGTRPPTSAARDLVVSPTGEEGPSVPVTQSSDPLNQAVPRELVLQEHKRSWRAG